MPQIFLAYEGKVDFLVKTNPFGGGKQDEQQESAEEKSAKLAKEQAKALKFDLMMIKARRKQENGAGD